MTQNRVKNFSLKQNKIETGLLVTVCVVLTDIMLACRVTVESIEPVFKNTNNSITSRREFLKSPNDGRTYLYKIYDFRFTTFILVKHCPLSFFFLLFFIIIIIPLQVVSLHRRTFNSFNLLIMVLRTAAKENELNNNPHITRPRVDSEHEKSI